MISFHHYNSHQHFAWMNALLTPPFPSLTLSFPQSMDECLSRQLTFTEGFLPVPTSSSQTLCSKPSSTLPFKRRKHLLANMVVQNSHSSWPSWVMGFVSFIFLRDRTMCWNHIQLWQGKRGSASARLTEGMVRWREEDSSHMWRWLLQAIFHGKANLEFKT